MGKLDNGDLLEMAVGLAEASISAPGNASAFTIEEPDTVTSFVDKVYRKLAELNNSPDAY